MTLVPGIRMYVVCHKTSYPENADAADDRFRWYVVNEAVPEKTIRAPPASVVNEWDLPVYEPGLQAAGCREASCLFHALANESLRDVDFIGFAQYDMRVPSAALDAFEDAVVGAEPGSAAKVGVGFMRPWDEVWSNGALPGPFWEELLRLFLPPGVPAPAEVPLFSTFVLPTEAFVEMMTAVNAIAPDIHAAIGEDTTHLAGTLERVFGIWIAAAVAAGRLDAVPLVGLVHDQTQRC
jgi:hypothetical protein